MKLPRFGSRSTRARKATSQDGLSRRRQLLPEALEPRLMMAVLDGTTETTPILSLSDPTPAVISVQDVTALQPSMTVSGAALDGLQSAPPQGASPPVAPPPVAPPPAGPAQAAIAPNYRLDSVERLDISYMVPVTRAMAAQERLDGVKPTSRADPVLQITLSPNAGLAERLNGIKTDLVNAIPSFERLKKLYDNVVNAVNNPGAITNVKIALDLFGLGAQTWIERFDVVAYYKVQVTRINQAPTDAPESRILIYKVKYFVDLTSIDGLSTGVQWGQDENATAKALGELKNALLSVGRQYDGDLLNDGNPYGTSLKTLRFMLWENGIWLQKEEDRPKW